VCVCGKRGVCVLFVLFVLFVFVYLRNLLSIF
jgi:hypothetical protein